MSSSAKGIHAHPELKLGKRPTVDKPKLKLSRLLTGLLPPHPVATDNLQKVAGFGLDSNDRFGVCVPTGYDNFRRITSTLLTGKAVLTPQDQIFTWYRTQNPGFDPRTDYYNEAFDQGMVIQDFLSYLAKTNEIVAFAQVDHTDKEEMAAALYLFLGLIVGVDLQNAQQDQTDTHPAVWDYSASGEWGGHCIVAGAYDAAGVDVITWAERVRMTQSFMSQQLDEAWVVIRLEHLLNPSFRAGIDIAALSAGYKQLTGRELPLPAPPTNPTPVAESLSFTLTDPEVVRRISRVAKGQTDVWATHHFRSYFGIK